MESEETESDRTSRKPLENDNVVRFVPRDWLGSPDELVPFGPDAPPVEAPTGAPSADSFWGGNPALHDPVTPDAEPANREEETRAEEYWPASRRFGLLDRLGRFDGVVRFGTRRVWGYAAGAVAVIAVALVVIASGAGSGSPARRGTAARHSHAPGARSVIRHDNAQAMLSAIARSRAATSEVSGPAQATEHLLRRAAAARALRLGQERARTEALRTARTSARAANLARAAELAQAAAEARARAATTASTSSSDGTASGTEASTTPDTGQPTTYSAPAESSSPAESSTPAPSDTPAPSSSSTSASGSGGGASSTGSGGTCYLGQLGC